MRQSVITLMIVLFSLPLIGCGKSQAEKDAEARKAEYQKKYDDYQRRLKETNDRFGDAAPAKDKHVEK